MEDSVAVGLEHLGVDVEARVPQLRDLLREKLHSLHRVAEDNGLVDLQLLCARTGKEQRDEC